MYLEENNSYLVLQEGGEAEIVEKKSRFIASIEKVESEEEAIAFIGQIKKKNWNASHNCYAYVIGVKGELVRCSDDGEPTGTAGKPMLEVLLGEEIRNIVVVVTRYFGGTLLGTGGLVRAYTASIKEGLKQCKIGQMRFAQEIEVKTDYNGIGKIFSVLGKYGLEPLKSNYTDVVELLLLIPETEVDNLKLELIEETNGKIKWNKTGSRYFIDKKAREE